MDSVMKEVYVLRHGDWDITTGSLKSSSQQKCHLWAGKFSTWNTIISSRFERCQDTAKLISGKPPKTDDRANIMNLSPDQESTLRLEMRKNPFGEAGVIMPNPRFWAAVKDQGAKLVSLIKELQNKLPEGGRALIISYDSTMVAATKIFNQESLQQVNYHFEELEGFVVDENLKVRMLK